MGGMFATPQACSGPSFEVLGTKARPEEDVAAMLTPMVERLHATHEQAVADEGCAFEKVWEHLGLRCSCETRTPAAETG